MIETIKESDEVLYPKESMVTVSKLDLDELKQMAKLNPRRRIRLCAHNNHKDLLHEMIIYHPKGTYVPPHKHINKDESFHLICGEIDCVIFDDKGVVEKKVPMANFSSAKIFYYRIPSGIYHTQIFKQDTFFHEVTKGPYNRENTVFPNWAPAESEHDLINEYMKKLNLQVQALLK